MKKFLPIFVFLASLGFADSKTDTTISPKKTGGSVIINGGTGQLLMKGATSNARISEGSGTTTLTNTDSRSQIFTLTAARTVVLPTTGIRAGETFIFINKSLYKLSIQSSGLNDVDNITNGRIVVVATQNTPTSTSHWITTEALSDWFSYTPTWGTSFGTVTNISMMVKRVGSDMEIRGRWQNGSVANDNNNTYMLIPSGYTVDTGRITPYKSRIGIGRSLWSAGTSGQAIFDLFVDDTSTDRIFFSHGETNGSGLYAKRYPNYWSNSNDTVSIDIKIPIAEWTMF